MAIPLRSPARTRTFLGLSLAGALVLVAMSASAPAPTQDAAAADSPLVGAMDGLQSGLRELRRELGEPSMADAARSTLRTMQSHAMTAFAQSPPKKDGMAEKDAALLEVEFRRQLLSLTGTLLDLEQAVLEGRHEEAKAGFAKLSEIKKLSHERFQIEDE